MIPRPVAPIAHAAGAPIESRPQLADAGISQDDYNAMMAVLISSFWADYVDHFADVIAANGLQMVTAE